ncbi:TorF family putative porin [Luteimonas sp. SX5]|uniref:TorF family putative porin n=1 Tax=Luteimonas galliterrae TaxID=2940486 RepID=A0ABT0MKJ1_9GAMM|nr:TorF family putative porin [Luteimonas galliterrae]MCL1634744.1 TorF family putative porin [Luteimonas galliterrae]
MSHHPASPRTVGALSAALAAAFSFGAQAAEVTGNATLTTDYVWRGSTQTQGDPAVQAGAKIAGESGLYGSVWGSNVEFAPETHASSEYDFTLGWGHSLNDDWTLDVNVLHYRYPSTTVELNWTELNGTATWKGNYWVSLGHSNEALGYDERGVYGLIGARFPVNDKFRFEAAAAYYDIKDLNGDDRDDSYAHGLVSAVWAFKAPAPTVNVEARLTAHATDSKAKDFFGEDFAGNRIEAALQASF